MKIINIPFIFYLIITSQLSFSKNIEVLKEQKFNITNNETVIGVISRYEISRIVFNSQIDSIHSIANEIEANAIDNDLYLKINVDKPINFFVKTKDGFTYKFILEVRDIPSTQLFVNAVNIVKSNILEPNSLLRINHKLNYDLQKRINQIIEISLHPKNHLGFRIYKLEKDAYYVGDISYKKIGKIIGKNLIAERITLTNKSDSMIQLNLKDFMKAEFLAVYLTKNFLEAGDSGTLIRVVEE